MVVHDKNAASAVVRCFGSWGKERRGVSEFIGVRDARVLEAA